MQLPPSQALSAIVKHYLVLESDAVLPLSYRIFSDGNPGIVFHYKKPFKQSANNKTVATDQPRSFIYGQITRYNDLLSGGNIGMVVAVLHPYAIYSLLGIAADDLNNNLLNLRDVYGQEAIDLEDQVESLGDPFTIISTIEKFLLSKTRSVNISDPLFAQAMQLIYRAKGIITVEDLLKKVPVTERQLERKFKRYTGLSPYKFSEINKFQNFLKLLQQHPYDQNISDLVYVSGYYDQSHINNRFKKTAGITPMQYKASNNLLAINFMQIQ